MQQKSKQNPEGRPAADRTSGFEAENDRYCHIPDSEESAGPADGTSYEGGPLSRGQVHGAGQDQAAQDGGEPDGKLPFPVWPGPRPL